MRTVRASFKSRKVTALIVQPFLQAEVLSRPNGWWKAFEATGAAGL